MWDVANSKQGFLNFKEIHLYGESCSHSAQWYRRTCPYTYCILDTQKNERFHYDYSRKIQLCSRRNDQRKNPHQTQKAHNCRPAHHRSSVSKNRTFYLSKHWKIATKYFEYL